MQKNRQLYNKQTNAVQLNLFDVQDTQTDGGLTVYRASAGSGKTYTLTLEYLKKALSNGYNPNKFREILAVTFTNKATDEMKLRIVNTLNNIIINSEPSVSEAICNELNINKTTLIDRAKRVQKAILHNYSCFSISTIDKFFQKIIHSFLKEAGLHPGFKLELDEDRLMDEAVDRMMKNLQKNEFLYEKMLEIIDEQMEDGRTWDIRKTIKEKGNEVLKEQFREFDADFHSKICDPIFMKNFADEISGIINAFDKKMKDIAKFAIKNIEDSNLQISDFHYGKSGAVNFFYKALSGIYEKGARVEKVLEDNIWFSKNLSEVVKNEFAQLESILTSLLTQAVNLYNRDYQKYCTALCIKQALNILGFMSEIETSVREIANIENLMPISETSHLLGKLVNESDTPFIYEKTGIRYTTFMIDEFQDTSAVQWRNFKPLLKNSLAENNTSLVVGDVKQSIYRWRNGDWRILANRIFDDFREFAISEKNLDTNWRSLPTVIEFNNSFFASFPQYIENAFTASLNQEEIQTQIGSAYKNAEQKVSEKNRDKGGYVSVSLIRDSETMKAKDAILMQLPEIIANMQDRGFKAGEIAIIVRKAADGQMISDCLLNHKKTSGDTKHCFEILSQDSLFISASDAVCFIVALLRALTNPGDRINNASINHFLHKNDERFDWENSGNLDNNTKQTLSKLVSLSLPEIFEHLVKIFDLGDNPDDIPYIQELHSWLISFSNKDISDVSAFLEYWDEQGDKIKLSAGKIPDAINIITIHKAKGLEYPVVVIPFCDWELKPRNETIWVSPETAPFNQLQHIPAIYGSAMKNSMFDKEYYYETMQSLIDNLNLMYVAFTRAKEELHVMLPLPKENKNNKADTLTDTAVSLANFLEKNLQDKMSIKIVNDSVLYLSGKKVCKQTSGQEDATTGLFVNKYVSSSFTKKLRIKYDYGDYFTEPHTPIQSRNYGNLMHKIFSTITTVADLPDALAQIEEDGLIAKNHIPELKTKIDSALNFASEWFSVGSKYSVITERYMLLPASMSMGISRKPDRIMCAQDETIVIDYKFGASKDEAHKMQVQNYMKLLSSMQYPNVKGCLWYVDLFEKVKIDG